MAIDIQYTGHHLVTTDALKDAADKKFNRLTRYFDRILSINVTFNVEHLDQIVEATVRVPGHALHAKAKDADMYAALDKIFATLKRQLIDHKEKQIEH